MNNLVRFPRSLVFALFLALAPPAKALDLPLILSATVSGTPMTTLTIMVQGFPSGALVVQFNNVTLANTYNSSNGKIIATLPAVQAPGTYLLQTWPNGCARLCRSRRPERRYG